MARSGPLAKKFARADREIGRPPNADVPMILNGGSRSGRLLAPLILAICRSSTICAQGPTSGAPPLSIVARIPLPGGTQWDHITADAVNRRLYLAHDSHIDILDLDRDTVVAVIANAPGAHGVALATNVGRGFTSNGDDSSLTVFDLTTNATLARVRLRVDAPDGIAYDPSTRRIFAMHATKPSLSVIDAARNEVLQAIELGGQPDGGVVDGRGHLLVALKSTSELVDIDTRSLSIAHRWPLSPCKAPDAIVFDNARNRVLLGCGNGVAVVVDPRDGRVATQFPIGRSVDGIGIDGDGRVVVSCGDGTVHVARWQSDKLEIEQVVKIPPGSPNSAVDVRTGARLLAGETNR